MKVSRIVVVVVFIAVSLSVMAQEVTRMQSATSLMQDEEWAKAAKLFEEIVNDEPKNALAWIQLARAYDELGEFDRELDAAQKSIDAGFQAPRIAMISMARAYVRKGDNGAALTKIEEVAAGGPSTGLKQRLETTAAFDSLKEDARWQKAIKDLTPCTTEEYRQFDFWVGDFKVEDPNGTYVGDNEITFHLGGCMLFESWKGNGGMHGMSMNYYDPSDETWNQIFLDNSGVPSNWPPLKGRFENGSMVLWTPEGESRTRWIWTKIDENKVRQMAETTTDGGKTWQTVWDSYYLRK